MDNGDKKVPKPRVSKEEAWIDEQLQLYYNKIIYPEVLKLATEIAEEGVFSLKTF